MAKILLVHTEDDVACLPYLKGPLSGHEVKLLRDEQLMVWVQIAGFCQKHSITNVVTTHRNCLAYSFLNQIPARSPLYPTMLAVYSIVLV